MDATAPRLAPRILAVFVNLLRVRRASVARSAEALRSEAANALSQRDLSDLWDDQGPSVDSDASTSLMLEHRAERRLREIEEALTRVADGTYGYCVDCGAGIALARLRALPATANCVKCSRRSSHRICELVYQDHVTSNKIRARSVAGHRAPVPGGQSTRMYTGSEWRQQYRLLGERDRLRDQRNELLVAATSEPGYEPPHVTNDEVVTQAATIRDRLAAIDEALDRIESGDYGVCLVCGSEIADQRLKAVPTAEVWRKCAA